MSERRGTAGLTNAPQSSRACRRRVGRAPAPPDIVLMPRLPRRLKERLAREEAPMRGGLMRLSLGDASLAALELEIGVRLYGVAGAILDLDRTVEAAPRHAALQRAGDALALCQRLDTLLVIVSSRPAAVMRALLAPVLPARHAQVNLPGDPARGWRRACPSVADHTLVGQRALGRRRSTTSTPTISIPSGGAG